MPQEKALVWFRRDLRDYDHAALSAALAAAREVFCAFVFDTRILHALPSKFDRRVHFIRESLLELDTTLRRRGGCLKEEMTMSSVSQPVRDRDPLRKPVTAIGSLKPASGSFCGLAGPVRHNWKWPKSD